MTESPSAARSSSERSGVVVIGAGPAGLTAAYELLRRGVQPLILEASKTVGGIARTEVYRGYRFDIGGHRFFTKIPEVQQLWEEILGNDFLVVPRLSRILNNGRFFNYPLKAFNALGQTGLVESTRIVLSYLSARMRPKHPVKTFEDWVVNRFGRRLYEILFRGYTEKIWGLPCHTIGAEWAAQRIRSLSLSRALANALFGNQRTSSLIDQFHYPAYGPGMMWEGFRQVIEAGGGEVRVETPVVGLVRRQDEICAVAVLQNEDQLTIPCSHVISSMPVSDLVCCLQPPPPENLARLAADLRYRAMVVVGLILDVPDLFPDNWIYVHDTGVRLGRIQNFKNWSCHMCADKSTTNLGIEYFCDEGDDLWNLADEELISLAVRELAGLGLARSRDFLDGVVYRQARAYPVYDLGYRERIAGVRDYLASIVNLQTIGRNGLHRYNNQDHSMVTAARAVCNLFGEHHDLWNINTEQLYYEHNEN